MGRGVGWGVRGHTADTGGVFTAATAVDVAAVVAATTAAAIATNVCDTVGSRRRATGTARTTRSYSIHLRHQSPVQLPITRCLRQRHALAVLTAPPDAKHAVACVNPQVHKKGPFSIVFADPQGLVARFWLAIWDSV